MIIVTGAAGFIGSVVVAALNKAGIKDVLTVDTLGKDTKFKNLRAKSYIDIVTPQELLDGLKSGAYKPGAIIHMGAITDTSESDADLLLMQNTKFTRKLAVYAMENDVRFIYASSASVYGDGEFGFDDGDDLTPKLLPMNPYAFSKWMFDTESIDKGWTKRIAGLRFFNVFGPNEYHKARMASVIWHSYNQIKDTGKIKLFESHREGIAHGGQRRDFVYVMDVVDVILWFLNNPQANGIYNLGTGKARSFNELANAIFAAMGKAPEIEYIPTPENIRAAYQYFTEAGLNKLRAAGCAKGFAPLEDTVRDYITGYLMKSNPHA
jgi:ADP-L-glycero-D-manno-heptose 6-epimerase